MGARLIPQGPGQSYHQLVLASDAEAGHALALVQAAVASAQLGSDLNGGEPSGGAVELVAGARLLTLRDLKAIATALADHQFALEALSCSDRRTLVAARALGLEARHPVPTPANQPGGDGAQESSLTVHQGTLRSGDHLQVEGSVLVLGDVNPGARISARGHVLVWGKLRGVAHAGLGGDGGARIVALQLRPLQLRIADQVARGPEGLPPQGFAEEARLVDGAIQIDPASPSWPLIQLVAADPAQSAHHPSHRHEPER